MRSPAEAEISTPLCPGALDADNHAVCLSFFADLSPKWPRRVHDHVQSIFFDAHKFSPQLALLLPLLNRCV